MPEPSAQRAMPESKPAPKRRKAPGGCAKHTCYFQSGPGAGTIPGIARCCSIPDEAPSLPAPKRKVKGRGQWLPLR